MKISGMSKSLSLGPINQESSPLLYIIYACNRQPYDTIMARSYPLRHFIRGAACHGGAIN